MKNFDYDKIKDMEYDLIENVMLVKMVVNSK